MIDDLIHHEELCDLAVHRAGDAVDYRPDLLRLSAQRMTRLAEHLEAESVVTPGVA